MEIDGDVPTQKQSEAGINKRQKLNTTNAKILIKPAIGGALVPDNRAIVINTQFFDDPFGISREEVSSQSKERAESFWFYFPSLSLLQNNQLLSWQDLFQGLMPQIVLTSQKQLNCVWIRVWMFLLI